MAIEIADLETFKGYQTKLKVEAGKVKKNGYFALFDKYKFKEGNKPLLLVLPRKDMGLEKFITTNGAKVKASGTCEESEQGLVFTALKGSIKTSEVKSFGISGKVVGDTEEGGDGKQVETKPTTEDGEKKKENKWVQAKKPTEPREEGEVIIGSAGQQKREIEAYIKNRTDLIEFAKEFQKDMEYFNSRAEAIVLQANGLTERADKGERSPVLEKSISAALKNANEIREAAHESYETKGKHLAKERTVKALEFIKDKAVAQRVGQENKHYFEEATVITKKVSELHREILLELGEVIRSLKLAQSTVSTGQPNVKDLVAYLDDVLNSLAKPAENLRKAADARASINALQFMATDTKKDAPAKLSELNQWRLTIATKKMEVAEGMDQVQRLVKFGLNRLKTGPQSNPEIKERFEKFKGVLSTATTQKREFDKGVLEFEKLASELEKTLK